MMATDYFQPSEVARLILGYLKSKGLKKSYSSFLRECPDLQEYWQLLYKGSVPTTNVMGLSLNDILNEFCELKQASVRSKQMAPSSRSQGQIQPSICTGGLTVSQPQQMGICSNAATNEVPTSSLAEVRGKVNPPSSSIIPDDGRAPSPTQSSSHNPESEVISVPTSKMVIEGAGNTATTIVTQTSAQLEDPFDRLLEDTRIHERLADSINRALKDTNFLDELDQAMAEVENVDVNKTNEPRLEERVVEELVRPKIDNVVALTTSDPQFEKLLSLVEHDAPNLLGPAGPNGDKVQSKQNAGNVTSTDHLSKTIHIVDQSLSPFPVQNQSISKASCDNLTSTDLPHPKGNLDPVDVGQEVEMPFSSKESHDAASASHSDHAAPQPWSKECSRRSKLKKVPKKACLKQIDFIHKSISRPRSTCHDKLEDVDNGAQLFDKENNSDLPPNHDSTQGIKEYPRTVDGKPNEGESCMVKGDASPFDCSRRLGPTSADIPGPLNDGSSVKLCANECASLPALLPSMQRSSLSPDSTDHTSPALSAFKPSSRPPPFMSPPVDPLSQRRVISVDCPHPPYIPDHCKKVPTRRITPVEVSYWTPSPLQTPSPSSPANFIIDIPPSPAIPVPASPKVSKSQALPFSPLSKTYTTIPSQPKRIPVLSASFSKERMPPSSHSNVAIEEGSRSVHLSSTSKSTQEVTDHVQALGSNDVSPSEIRMPLSPSKRKPRRIVPIRLSSRTSKSKSPESGHSFASPPKRTSSACPDDAKTVSSSSDLSLPSKEEAFRMLKSHIFTYSKPQPTQEITSSAPAWKSSPSNKNCCVSKAVSCKYKKLKGKNPTPGKKGLSKFRTPSQQDHIMTINQDKASKSKTEDDETNTPRDAGTGRDSHSRVKERIGNSACAKGVEEELCNNSSNSDNLSNFIAVGTLELNGSEATSDITFLENIAHGENWDVVQRETGHETSPPSFCKIQEQIVSSSPKKQINSSNVDAASFFHKPDKAATEAPTLDCLSLGKYSSETFHHAQNSSDVTVSEKFKKRVAEKSTAGQVPVSGKKDDQRRNSTSNDDITADKPPAPSLGQAEDGIASKNVSEKSHNSSTVKHVTFSVQKPATCDSDSILSSLNKLDFLQDMNLENGKEISVHDRSADFDVSRGPVEHEGYSCTGDISLAAPYFPELSNTRDFFKRLTGKASLGSEPRFPFNQNGDTSNISSSLKNQPHNQALPSNTTSHEKEIANLPSRASSFPLDEGSTCASLLRQAMNECDIPFISPAAGSSDNVKAPNGRSLNEEGRIISQEVESQTAVTTSIDKGPPVTGNVKQSELTFRRPMPVPISNTSQPNLGNSHPRNDPTLSKKYTPICPVTLPPGYSLVYAQHGGETVPFLLPLGGLPIMISQAQEMKLISNTNSPHIEASETETRRKRPTQKKSKSKLMPPQSGRKSHSSSYSNTSRSTFKKPNRLMKSGKKKKALSSHGIHSVKSASSPKHNVKSVSSSKVKGKKKERSLSNTSCQQQNQDYVEEYKPKQKIGIRRRNLSGKALKNPHSSYFKRGLRSQTVLRKCAGNGDENKLPNLSIQPKLPNLSMQHVESEINDSHTPENGKNNGKTSGTQSDNSSKKFPENDQEIKQKEPTSAILDPAGRTRREEDCLSSNESNRTDQDEVEYSQDYIEKSTGNISSNFTVKEKDTIQEIENEVKASEISRSDSRDKAERNTVVGINTDFSNDPKILQLLGNQTDGCHGPHPQFDDSCLSGNIKEAHHQIQETLDCREGDKHTDNDPTSSGKEFELFAGINVKECHVAKDCVESKSKTLISIHEKERRSPIKETRKQTNLKLKRKSSLSCKSEKEGDTCIASSVRNIQGVEASIRTPTSKKTAKAICNEELNSGPDVDVSTKSFDSSPTRHPKNLTTISVQKGHPTGSRKKVHAKTQGNINSNSGTNIGFEHRPDDFVKPCALKDKDKHATLNSISPESSKNVNKVITPPVGAPKIQETLRDSEPSPSIIEDKNEDRNIDVIFSDKTLHVTYDKSTNPSKTVIFHAKSSCQSQEPINTCHQGNTHSGVKTNSNFNREDSPSSNNTQLEFGGKTVSLPLANSDSADFEEHQKNISLTLKHASKDWEKSELKIMSQKHKGSCLKTNVKGFAIESEITQKRQSSQESISSSGRKNNKNSDDKIDVVCDFDDESTDDNNDASSVKSVDLVKNCLSKILAEDKSTAAVKSKEVSFRPEQKVSISKDIRSQQSDLLSLSNSYRNSCDDQGRVKVSAQGEKSRLNNEEDVIHCRHSVAHTGSDAVCPGRILVKDPATISVPKDKKAEKEKSDTENKDRLLHDIATNVNTSIEKRETKRECAGKRRKPTPKRSQTRRKRNSQHSNETDRTSATICDSTKRNTDLNKEESSRICKSVSELINPQVKVKIIREKSVTVKVYDSCDDLIKVAPNVYEPCSIQGEKIFPSDLPKCSKQSLNPRKSKRGTGIYAAQVHEIESTSCQLNDQSLKKNSKALMRTKIFTEECDIISSKDLDKNKICNSDKKRKNSPGIPLRNDYVNHQTSLSDSQVDFSGDRSGNVSEDQNLKKKKSSCNASGSSAGNENQHKSPCRGRGRRANGRNQSRQKSGGRINLKSEKREITKRKLVQQLSTKEGKLPLLDGDFDNEDAASDKNFMDAQEELDIAVSIIEESNNAWSQRGCMSDKVIRSYKSTGGAVDPGSSHSQMNQPLANSVAAYKMTGSISIYEDKDEHNNPEDIRLTPIDHGKSHEEMLNPRNLLKGPSDPQQTNKSYDILSQSIDATLESHSLLVIGGNRKRKRKRCPEHASGDSVELILAEERESSNKHRKDKERGYYPEHFQPFTKSTFMYTSGPSAGNELDDLVHPASTSNCLRMTISSNINNQYTEQSSIPNSEAVDPFGILKDSEDRDVDDVKNNSFSGLELLSSVAVGTDMSPEYSVQPWDHPSLSYLEENMTMRPLSHVKTTCSPQIVPVSEPATSSLSLETNRKVDPGLDSNMTLASTYGCDVTLASSEEGTFTMASNNGGDVTVASNNGGDITVASNNGGGVTMASSNGGDITVASSNGGDVTVASSNGGDVTVASSNGGDVTVASSNGGDVTVASSKIVHVTVASRTGGDSSLKSTLNPVADKRTQSLPSQANSIPQSAVSRLLKKLYKNKKGSSS